MYITFHNNCYKSWKMKMKMAGRPVVLVLHSNALGQMGSAAAAAVAFTKSYNPFAPEKNLRLKSKKPDVSFRNERGQWIPM